MIEQSAVTDDQSAWSAAAPEVTTVPNGKRRRANSSVSIDSTAQWSSLTTVPYWIAAESWKGRASTALANGRAG